ncbi:MAG: hypothetical protein HYT87_02530 [Nitrospirae bacterium]|nr:hypothetical protein [Nitrospirota bacterium]
MGTRINTNMGAILATLNLNRNFSSAQSSIQKLSSGLRIVSPSDDIPGLAISQRLNADAVGFAQSGRNAAEAINLIQMADSATSGVVDILNKMRSLSLQATNGTVDSAGRKGLDIEFTNLKSEVQRVLSTTKYGSISLMATTNSTGGTGSAVSISTSQTLSGLKFALGPAANNLVPFVFGNGISSVENSLRVAGGIVTGAAATNAGMLQLGTMSSISSAKSVLTSVDAAVKSLSFFRGALGGAQDTFIQAQKSDENTNANLTASLSQIRDVDFASEVANFTSKSILTQAGMAFLAQANLLQQSVLTLLG